MFPEFNSMKNLCRLSLFFVLYAGACLAASDRDIHITRVAGSEYPGDYKHPASVTELDNGDLYVTYYCGEGEYAVETAVWGIRRKKGELVWSKPKIIADTPWRSEGNPVVWQAPDGLVWLFYNVRWGDTWATARVKGKVSYDGANTWSDSFMLTLEEGTMARGAPIVLDNGEYLLPLYLEVTSSTEWTDKETSSFFMRYNPKTHQWTESGWVRSEKGNLQAEPAQIDDDYLIAYIRRAGDFLPTEDGYTLRSESRDGGYTWSDAVQSEFKNPNSAVGFIKLQNGHLLLVYNDNMNDRTPLSVTISTDNDKTYPYRRDIGGGDNTFAYPYVIQGKDGTIHVVYTTNNRTTVMLASFKEEAITGWDQEEE
jgi:predicted neuraminidase